MPMLNSAIYRKILFSLLTVGSLLLAMPSALAQEYPTFEELSETRAQAHQDRFKTYVLKKLEVYSYA